MQVYETNADGECQPVTSPVPGNTFEYFRLGPRVEPAAFELVAYVID